MQTETFQAFVEFLKSHWLPVLTWTFAAYVIGWTHGKDSAWKCFMVGVKK